eukprot:GFUD01039185.1.p1 GENE.GFUD01039185.1~~GFUD01039185.1.p1  ORF type:complete len:173 (+),score=23.77 GFUD01039185.1:56-574(+)
MADRMWGGVPFTIPSKTAMKYLSGAVQVKRECNLPAGGHYNSRKTMDREMIGHRQSRKDMLESYSNFERQERQMRSEPRQRSNSGVRASRLTAGDEYRQPMNPQHYHEKTCSFGPSLTRCPIFRSNKPGAGIGWTEPRVESFIGMVDRRKRLPGYVGGVKLRDSVFANATRI